MRRDVKIFAVCLLSLAATVALFAGPSGETAATAAAYTIEVTGSTSVAPLMERLAEAYKAVNANVTINVSGTGSGDGITGANTGVAEVGMSSRNLRPTELGFGLDVLTIAVDAIAVIVHPTNSVSNLTAAQVKSIYTGEIRNWSEVGGPNAPIAVVSREPGSGTRGAFEEIIGFVDKLVAGAIEFDGTGGVRASVAGNVNAIGYISLGSLTGEVKGLRVDGVEATPANVIDGSYRVARPFLLLYREPKINVATKAFLQWVMTADGQAIVKQRGYVPMQ